MIKFFSLLFFFATISLIGQTSIAPMGGTWYNADSKEIFAIQTDNDNSIQGRGVYYAKGGGNFKQMQIMTQTSTPEGYMMRCYDPAKPNMVFELRSFPASYGQGVQIRMTRTGSRKKIHYFEDLLGAVPETKGLAKKKGWELIRTCLLEKTWTDKDKRPNSPLTFAKNNAGAKSLQDGEENPFTVDNNTFDITTHLSNYGDVTIKLLYDAEWFFEVRDEHGDVVSLMSGL
jgi:hypothetical protein